MKNLTVKKLIEELQKLDGDKEIEIFDVIEDESFSFDIEEVNGKIRFNLYG